MRPRFPSVLSIWASAVLTALLPSPMYSGTLEPVEQTLPGGNAVRIVKCYPEGRMRASCLSFDDGTLGSDWPVLEALNKHHIPATFFINSTHTQSRDAVKFPARYVGHEIASHGANHKGLPELTEEQLRSEIETDQRILGEKFGQPITGFAYPYGAVCKEPEKQSALELRLASFGLIYARGVGESKSFAPPEDFIRWKPDCGFMDRIEKFLEQPATDTVRVRMCFTHSIDFARGTISFDNWLEILDKLAAEPSIWHVTMRDYTRYIIALRHLNPTADGLSNEADVPVWVKINEHPHEIPAHASLKWTNLLPR